MSSTDLAIQRSDKLTTLAANAIADAIVRGEFAPGEALPEVPLARRLATSRNTVREALREVEALGLVEIESHRGAFVRELTRERASEIFSLRAVLESFAARLSVERTSGDELAAAMRSALEAQREAVRVGDMLAIVRSDMAFHERLSSSCGHELLLSHLKALQMETRRFIVAGRQHADEYSPIVDLHLPIVDAVESGDARLVESLVYSHVMTSGERLLDRLVDLDRD
ncbi:MAG: GntR family transcriptional regulator [Microbacteriaceae bacterium]